MSTVKTLAQLTVKTEYQNKGKMEGSMVKSETEEKTMRGLKTKDTPILTGYQIFHNYIRSHEGLEGKTPSEACGIEIKERTNG